MNDFNNSSDYYVLYGFGRDKNLIHKELVGLLPVEDMSSYSYYSTGVTKEGEGYVAVWLSKDEGMNNYMGNDYNNYFNQNPFVLYFMGRDDGSFSKRFKNKEESINYIKSAKSLDEVIDENIGAPIMAEMKRKKERITDIDMNTIYELTLIPEN